MFDLFFNEGFGPNNGRSPPNERLKDVYSNGYTPGSDTHPNAPINVNPNSGSITDRNSGTHSKHGKGPSSSLGSDSFLNRPVNPNSQTNQNGKNTEPSSNDNGRPSILATRRPIPNGSGPDKLVDATNDGNTNLHTNSRGPYTPSTDSGRPSNTRQPHRHRTGPNSSDYDNANTDSSDNSPHGKNPPVRTSGYDTSANEHGGHGGQGGHRDYGHSDNSKTQTGNGLQPYDQLRNRNPSVGKDTSEPESPPGPQTTDVLSGFRNVFKLPPGLCLVKCESLRPGQALTPDQIRDAFVSSGLDGKR